MEVLDHGIQIEALEHFPELEGKLKSESKMEIPV